MSEELKPCLRCNGSNAFVERADLSSCYVVCNDCGARGPTSCNENDEDCAAEDAGMEPGESAARRLWNTRPAPKADGMVEELRHLLDRDRYIVAIALGHIRKALSGHRWLLEGRGPYEWDDDRYRDEFTAWVKDVEASTGLLAKLAWDKDDCTTDAAKVQAAREAARIYAVDPPVGHRDALPSDLGLPCHSCAALSKDRDVVLEEAAKVAEDLSYKPNPRLGKAIAKRIAANIRSLKGGVDE